MREDNAGGGEASAPRRFYETAAATPAEGGFVVSLDGRRALTRGRAPLAFPTRAVVEAVAAEWAAQGETIDPRSMPMTRLLSTTIDLGPAEADIWRARTIEFLKADCLCYRAEEPAALVARQTDVWDPFLAWAAGALGVRLAVTSGVGFVAQPADAALAATAALRNASAGEALALRIIAETTGSAVLALARWRRAFDADAIYAAARLDEDFQIEQWGEDAEARARDQAMRADFDAAGRFIDLLKEA